MEYPVGWLTSDGRRATTLLAKGRASRVAFEKGLKPAAQSPAVEALAARHRRMCVLFIVIVVLGAVVAASNSPRAEMLFTLAVAPSLYLLWHFHHADKYKAEAPGLLVGTFVLGGVLAMAAAFVEPDQPKTADVATLFLYFLVGVALVEEIVKLIAVRAYAYRSVHFDESMDGVIFGITAAIGFATVENLAYVFQYGGSVAIFRAFVSVPGHVFYGAIIGYYLGEAKMLRKWWLALVGLAIATFFHGLFDTLATTLPELPALFVLPAMIYLIYFLVVRREIAKAQSESKYSPSQ